MKGLNTQRKKMVAGGVVVGLLVFGLVAVLLFGSASSDPAPTQGVAPTTESRAAQLGRSLLAMVASGGLPSDSSFARIEDQERLDVAVQWQTGLRNSFTAVRGVAQLTCAPAGELYSYRVTMTGRPAYAVANAKQVAALQVIGGEKIYYLADCDEQGLPQLLEEQPSKQVIDELFPTLGNEEGVRAPVREAFRLLHKRYEADKNVFKRPQVERVLKTAAAEQLAAPRYVTGAAPRSVLNCKKPGLQIWLARQGHSAALSYNDGKQIAFMARVRAQILELTVLRCAELTDLAKKSP